MEITSIAKQIQGHIGLLEIGRKELQKRAEEKAKAMSECEKQMAITIIHLAIDKEVLDGDGELIKDIGATNREVLAKGVCNKHRYEMDLATSRYKNAVTGLTVIMAELNALQSIFRHLDNT